MFLQAVGHGMEPSFLAEAMKATREFFNLPLEEKQKYSNIVDGVKLGMYGYGNDMVVKENQVHDWYDRLNLLVEPESLRTYRLWPTQPPSFRYLPSSSRLLPYFFTEGVHGACCWRL